MTGLQVGTRGSGDLLGACLPVTPLLSSSERPTRTLNGSGRVADKRRNSVLRVPNVEPQASPV